MTLLRVRWRTDKTSHMPAPYQADRLHFECVVCEAEAVVPQEANPATRVAPRNGPSDGI
jgi:hypothetical protein